MEIKNGVPGRMDFLGLATSKGGWFSALCLGLSGVADIVLELMPTATSREQVVVRAAARIFGGMAVFAIALKLKNNSDIVVASEAEKRIADPGLPASSKVPVIQKEIEAQLADPDAVASRITPNLLPPG